MIVVVYNMIIAHSANNVSFCANNVNCHGRVNRSGNAGLREKIAYSADSKGDRIF